MSKLEMLEFDAALPISQKSEFLENLQNIGVVHIKEYNDTRLIDISCDNGAEYEKSKRIIENVIEILSRRGVKFSSFLNGRKPVEREYFKNKSKEAQKILNDAKQLIYADKIVSESLSEITRIDMEIEMLSGWITLDISPCIRQTQYTKVFIGSFPHSYSYSELLKNLSEHLSDVTEYDFEIISDTKYSTNVFLICHNSIESIFSKVLADLGFTEYHTNSVQIIKESIKSLNDDRQKLLTVVEDNENLIKLFERTDDIKFAYDYFTVKSDEQKELEKLKKSSYAFFISGYVPSKFKNRLSEEVKKSSGTVFYKTPDDNDDEVPVLLSNGNFSSPVETVVEMFALPGKRDIDPSAAISFFYYLLFGLMLSDAGYGILMTVFTGILLRKTSVEGTTRNMMKMFFYCGISTIVWGALFGSWFGDLIPVIYTHFLGKPSPDVALWFEPVKDPIKLLLFSFLIGICHLFLGVFLSGVVKYRNGEKVSAFLDTVPVLLTVLGAVPFGASVLVNVSKSILSASKYVLILGVVMILLTSSVSGNILKRIGGGFYSLYNVASGFLSDILSYSRLLALGLATGSIASVVNMLGVMPESFGLKCVLFPIVFVIGHTLNLAVNLLGAYVHTNRLQFVELFSKFYIGGGKRFEPFRMNTRYYKLMEEKIDE